MAWRHHGCISSLTATDISLVAFTITDAKIVAIDLIDDPGRIAEVDLVILDR